ncbi:DrmE family protein [Paenibacillus residui]|uniref:DrmE family protein n=1 Tax=Paenibacillus residui TaxID=629724 RepID=A0ABW3DBZ2_9BACL
MAIEVIEKLRCAIDKATFLTDNKRIQDNVFIAANVDFIVEILTNSNRERGIILHPGTSLTLYLATVLSCFNSFLTNDADSAAFINDLSVGDLVIYENKRSEFKGIDNEGRFILVNFDKGGTSTKNLVPPSQVNKISPYYGNAKTLDGRGIRNKSKSKKILSELFGMKPTEIKNTFGKSVIIVCSRSEADRLMDRLSVSVKDKVKGLQIGGLFPAAYYTQDEQYNYSGNSARIEPILKFTSKLSVARDLIIDNKGVETLIVDGADYITQDISELASIYNRSSLKSILMICELYNSVDSAVFQQFDDLKTLIWTKDKINVEYQAVSMSHIGDICDESKDLGKLLSNALNLKSNLIEVDNRVHDGIFHECKKILYKLSQYNEENVNVKLEGFISKGFWLLNLMEKSFFPLTTMENMIRERKINALSPSEELINMQSIINQFNLIEYHDSLMKLVNSLLTIKREIDRSNAKYDYLLEYLRQLKYTNRKIAVIGYKTYYRKVFIESIPDYLKPVVQKCDFFTPGRFNSSKFYHDVLVMSVNGWDKLNPLLLSNTEKVSFVLYKNEKNRFKQAEKKTYRRLSLFGSPKLFESEGQNAESAAAIEELDESVIEEKLDKIVGQFEYNFAVNHSGFSEPVGAQTSEIVKVAILDTGEKVFFSRYYCPYVFDIDRQTVEESELSLLKPGDLLIFANYDNDAKDIVEKIMDIILDNKAANDSFKESYQKSLYWKSVLKQYMQNFRLTYSELSIRMSRFGKGKHEVTLRSWLDEGSHIVGPRDLESFRTIAKLTGDPLLSQNPDSFLQACREVRTMRIRILKYIERNIIASFNKNINLQNDEILSKLPIDLTELSRVVQVDKLIDAENLVVPYYMANKPQIL